MRARLSRSQDLARKELHVADKPDRNCTHLAGEYFVAAELCRRGYSIGVTMGNAKAVDLLAEKGSKTIAIQVKAIVYLNCKIGIQLCRQPV